MPKPHYFVVLVGCLTAAWSCAWAQSKFTERCMRGAAAPIQGVASHFGFKNAQLGNMALIKESGFESIRDEVFWSHVEDDSGTMRIPAQADTYVNAAVQAGLEPLLLLGYGNSKYDNGDKPRSPQARQAWVRYATLVVQHFKGRVRHFELWNEWDHHLGNTTPGSPQDYVRLVAQASAELRRVNPNVCIIAGAVTSEALRNGWLTSAVELGLLNHIDALSVHTYNFTEREARNRTPEAWYQQVDSLKKLLQPTGTNRPSLPLYVTEMGWPNHLGRFGISESRQAAFAARTFLLSRSIKHLYGLWWYGWQDKGTDFFESEHHYGVVDAKGQPKMTWRLLAEQSRLLQGMQFMGYARIANAYWLTQQRPAYLAMRFGTVPLDLPPKAGTKNPATQVHKQALALWRTDETPTGLTSSKVLLIAAKGSRLPSAHFSSSCSVRPIANRAGAWTITLKDTPCLASIEGAWL